MLFHTVFNLAVALIGLPLVGALAWLLVRLTPDAPLDSDLGQPKHLDASVADTPSEALACASTGWELPSKSVTRMSVIG